jgi:hypothetical protein
MFQHQAGAPREIPNDSNATPFPPGGPREFATPLVPPGALRPILSPVDEFKAKGSFVSAAPEHEMYTTVVSKEPLVSAHEPETKVSLATAHEVLVTPKLEEESAPSLKQPEALLTVTANASPPEPGEVTPPPSIGKQQPPSPAVTAIAELPKLDIPPPESPVESTLVQNRLLEVSDPPSQPQSTLFSPVPARATALEVPPSKPSLEPSGTLQSVPVNGLTEVTTSSPVSSVAPTPSLQTPSPPHAAPEVIVAAPTVKESEDELVRTCLISPALQGVGVSPVVPTHPDIFPAHAKEAESLTGALHIVVGARLQLDLQSREERVNPILMSNRAVATASPNVPVPSADTLVQEVLAGQRAQGTTQTFYSHVRDSLVAHMTTRQESVDEKVARLRKEYLALHREWVARCAELDNSHRVDPAAGEVAAIPARTTRRSAAVLGDAVRSDLEMEQIIASLGNDELYDPAHLALRNLAVIPDMISVTHGKVDAVFDDVNNAVDDPITFYDPSPGLAEWTDTEVEIYKQRFAKYPKQFGHIAAGLADKTQAQCVQFYYLYKKALIDFREAVTTYGQSKRRRGGRKTDKKKGGLLADIRQHDAEMSKEQDPVKRRASTAARKRRESARAAQRRSVTAIQQEEQTPVTTPTPEPDLESVRPKRRRSNRPATEPEPVVRTEEEPPVKRSRRAPRKPRPPVPDASTSEPKPMAIELPGVVTESQSDQPVQQRTRSSTAWSAEDKGQGECELAGMSADAVILELFMGLLAQYGKDFKRIAASMPNKVCLSSLVPYSYVCNLSPPDYHPSGQLLRV